MRLFIILFIFFYKDGNYFSFRKVRYFKHYKILFIFIKLVFMNTVSPSFYFEIDDSAFFLSTTFVPTPYFEIGDIALICPHFAFRKFGRLNLGWKAECWLVEYSMWLNTHKTLRIARLFTSNRENTKGETMDYQIFSINLYNSGEQEWYLHCIVIFQKCKKNKKSKSTIKCTRLIFRETVVKK